jgi:hypothetical protein
MNATLYAHLRAATTALSAESTRVFEYPISEVMFVDCSALDELKDYAAELLDEWEQERNRKDYDS